MKAWHPESASDQSRRAIVTGGSRGIGLAIARAMLADGGSVMITGRDRRGARSGRARRSQRAAGDAGARRAARPCDVRDRAGGAQARRRHRATSSAGSTRSSTTRASASFADVAAMSDDDWARVIDTNLTGVFYCTRAAIPAMKQVRRRLDHQHRQPGRPELLSRRRGVLRVEGRARRVQRVADAGSPLRQHPRQRRHAGLGGDRVRRARRRARTVLETVAGRCRGSR